jgi:hypothetical protein
MHFEGMNFESQPKSPHMHTSKIQAKVAGVRILCQNKTEDKSALYPKSRKMTSGDALTRE